MHRQSNASQTDINRQVIPLLIVGQESHRLNIFPMLGFWAEMSWRTSQGDGFSKQNGTVDP